MPCLKAETNAKRAPQEPETSEIVRFLQQPSSYREPTTRVDCMETHISWIFLTDRFAYKLKKSLRYDFLDFSTAARRRTACEHEVALNARLAPQVYLGVVPLTVLTNGRLSLDTRGAPCDWLVKMRRLPANRSLDSLIRKGILKSADLEALASRLAVFYEALPPVVMRVRDYWRHIDQHVRANRAELLNPAHGLDPAAVCRSHAAQLRLLQLAPEMLENRAGDGRVVLGHGDLRPEHIYFDPSPTVIDCIEFNEDFRRLDVLDELSFLAMECDYLNASWVGERVVERYCEVSGDRPAAALLNFYKSYRASVHAKVLSLRSDQHQGEPHCRDQELALRYLDLAGRYAEHLGPPLVVIVRGSTGSGKSTIGAALAERLGLDLLQSDRIRREIFGVGSRDAAYNQQIYSRPNRQRVYAEMFHRLEIALTRGLSVLLDATFLDTSNVDRAMRISESAVAAVITIDCRCPAAVARRRILRRLRGGSSLSDGTPRLVDLQRRETQPSHGDAVCRVDTTTSLPQMLDEILARLRQLPFYAAVLK